MKRASELQIAVETLTQSPLDETMSTLGDRNGLPHPPHRRIPHRPPKIPQTSQRRLDPSRHPRRLDRKTLIKNHSLQAGGLQQALIESVTAPGDPVLDPAAGSFSVLEACQLAGRTFVGCDVNG